VAPAGRWTGVPDVIVNSAGLGAWKAGAPRRAARHDGAAAAYRHRRFEFSQCFPHCALRQCLSLRIESPVSPRRGPPSSVLDTTPEDVKQCMSAPYFAAGPSPGGGGLSRIHTVLAASLDVGTADGVAPAAQHLPSTALSHSPLPCGP